MFWFAVIADKKDYFGHGDYVGYEFKHICILWRHWLGL